MVWSASPFQAIRGIFIAIFSVLLAPKFCRVHLPRPNLSDDLIIGRKLLFITDRSPSEQSIKSSQLVFCHLSTKHWLGNMLHSWESYITGRDVVIFRTICASSSAMTGAGMNTRRSDVTFFKIVELYSRTQCFWLTDDKSLAENICGSPEGNREY